MSLYRVPPFYYIHVLNNNTNVTRVETGPITFAKQDHEKLVVGPAPMLTLPPRHYCTIQDPAIRDEEGKPVVDDFDQIKLRHGDQEIRFAADWPEPFPLLPGEQLLDVVTMQTIVPHDTALRLEAKRDFVDDAGTRRVAGDAWLFYGPSTYVPRVEVDVTETVVAKIIKPNQALRLRALQEFVDSTGVTRKSGEEWLVRTTGAFLPHVDEIVVGVVNPVVLTEQTSLHLRASQSFTDVYGKERKAGEEWLVTIADGELHIQDVYEECVSAQVRITVLTKQQYCIVLDPVGPDGKNAYGTRQLRQGESSFFLLPGERLEGGIQSIFVLGEAEGLLLTCQEKFVDSVMGGDGVAVDIERTPGDLWMIYGPCDYVPRVEVSVVERRQSIPLDANEGIYVRDIKTGRVRSVRGQTYMLLSNEELWEKEMSPEVEELLVFNYSAQDKSNDKSNGLDAFGIGDGKYEQQQRKSTRDKTRVVTYRVPHNAAVQIYDYQKKVSRVVFGPGLVMLDPDEQFTVLSLSGDKPKRPNIIKTISLCLGPDFMTDIIEVETSDHARLRMQLSYNWMFDVKKDVEGNPDTAAAAKLFQVRDFVGDACKAVASRIRSAVASTTFESFHRTSAKLIRQSVFGVDANGKTGERFIFNQNGLTVTNIDIQTVEPVDERTAESLQKSVQLAIEITTKQQERNARHQAEQIEQTARGLIERQKIENQSSAEESRQRLIQLQAESAAVASTGTAKAEAEAKAEYLEIEAEADVTMAELTVQAQRIEQMLDLEQKKEEQLVELSHENALQELNLSKSKALADIETDKFQNMVSSISRESIIAIAKAGPEIQARLLKGLGLKGYLMTDGNSPINLFDAAKGMVSGGGVGGMTQFTQGASQ